MGLIFKKVLMRAGDWVTPSDIPAAEAAALKWLYDNTAGASWTENTNWGETATANDWSGITVAGGNVTVIDLRLNNLVGNIGAWAMGDFASMTACILGNNTSISGDISGWTLPASMVSFRIYSTSLSKSPALTSAVALADYLYQNCFLSQADVDAVCLAVYNRRLSFTNATPALNISGTNSVPSGVYQDGDPPTTGLEYVYEIANDPEIEGFNTWTVTYTGGSAP